MRFSLGHVAYYNENDPFAAKWLRELIKAGAIAGGEVDERSIEDVRPNDIRGFTQYHFFAGIGVWSYSLRLAGWPDDKPVWTGSCPCQPFSAAGKRKGTADKRHLWPAWHWLIKELRPPRIFGEQVASKDGINWLDLVSTDLEAEGYAVGSVVLPACGVGAPHVRSRLWFVADNESLGRQRRRTGEAINRAGQPEGPRATGGFWKDAEWIECLDGRTRPTKPGLFPLAHGITGRVGKLRGYGNAIVAPAAAEVIQAAMEYFDYGP